MRKIIPAIIITVCFAAVLFPLTASADDGTLTEAIGRTVYPIYDTDVEMEEEIIDIVVKDGCSYVTCQFFFHNTGKRTNLLVGFPVETTYYDDELGDFYEVLVPNLNWFRTFINGKRVPVSIRKGLKPEKHDDERELYYAKWHTWRMRFSADERIKVVNKYWVKNPINYSSGSEFVHYILRSGATWKGPIGKVTVRMRLEGYDMAFILFSGMEPTYIEEDGTIIWSAENLVPEDDIFVYDDSDYVIKDFANPFDKAKKKEFNKYSKMGTRLMRNFYAGHYNGVTWWGNKFFKEFGDVQSTQLYYHLGVSYYKLGYIEKALEMFEYTKETKDLYYIMSAYYYALICREKGDSAGYQNNLNILNEYEALMDSNYDDYYAIDWIETWVQSRLIDLMDKHLLSSLSG